MFGSTECHSSRWTRLVCPQYSLGASGFFEAWVKMELSSYWLDSLSKIVYKLFLFKHDSSVDMQNLLVPYLFNGRGEWGDYRLLFVHSLGLLEQTTPIGFWVTETKVKVTGSLKV